MRFYEIMSIQKQIICHFGQKFLFLTTVKLFSEPEVFEAFHEGHEFPAVSHKPFIPLLKSMTNTGGAKLWHCAPSV